MTLTDLLHYLPGAQDIHWINRVLVMNLAPTPQLGHQKVMFFTDQLKVAHPDLIAILGCLKNEDSRIPTNLLEANIQLLRGQSIYAGQEVQGSEVYVRNIFKVQLLTDSFVRILGDIGYTKKSPTGLTYIAEELCHKPTDLPFDLLEEKYPGMVDKLKVAISMDLAPLALVPYLLDQSVHSNDLTLPNLIEPK